MTGFPRLKPRLASAGLGVVLFLSLAACSNDGVGRDPGATTRSPAATDATDVSGDAVDISGLAFSPASIIVPAGTTVTWTNHDLPPHDVTFGDGEQSAQLDNGATYQRTFEDAGSFDYVCSLHPQMTGRVIVTATP